MRDTLQYFFSWNFISFWQKNPIKVRSFILLISPNLYFGRLLLLWVYKTLAKIVQRSYASWQQRLKQNLKKKRFLISKMTRTWLILIRELNKNLSFDWSLLCKLHNVWPKNVQRSHLSWRWRVIQNLKKSWLTVWKMTWGIWQMLTRALERVKIDTLMGSFCPK